MARLYRFWLFSLVAIVAAGCGGGSGESPAVPRPIAALSSVHVGNAARSVSLLAGESTVAIDFPATSSGSATMTLSGSATLPAGDPAITASFVDPATPGSIYQPVVSGSVPSPVPIAFLTLTASSTITFATFPTTGFALQPGSPTTGIMYFLGYYDPAASFWDLDFAGPASIGSSLNAGFSTLNSPQFGISETPPTGTADDPLMFVAGRTYGLVLYSITSST